MSAASVYRCAICDREVTYEGPRPSVYPFCSARCKMVDLGKWLREDYAIDRDLTPEDVDVTGYGESERSTDL
jgi:hypothetical protein